MAESVYSRAGVDIDKGTEAVTRIKEMVKRLGVNEIGKFSGFFPLKEEMKKPVLVSSADGVGTKLKIAFMMNKHDTVGKCLVNHCVNDILVYGAKPLFFLDYFAAGKLEPEVVSSIVSGILDGCLENNFVLLGGETAEMPGFYRDNEYDVAGFIVGIIDQDKIVDGKNIRAGDLVIGLPSTGLHTNGYSLARYILFDQLKLTVDSMVEGIPRPIGEELLNVHRSYLKPVMELMKNNLIKGMAHITGGGFLDNIPRILPGNVSVQIERVWPVPGIFNFLCDRGNVGFDERFRVFNMGIGMVLFIDKNNLSRVESTLNDLGEVYYLMGQAIDKKNDRRIIINH